MHLLKFLGFEAYYGSIITTMLVQLLATIFLLYNLRRQYKVSYKNSIKTFIKTILLNLIMLLVLMIVRLFIGQFPTTRLYSILEIIIYAIIGIVVYGYLSIKNGILQDVFGNDFINKILNKLHMKKVK